VSAATAALLHTTRIEIDDGPAFPVGPQEDTLLRAALRAGLAFPYECSVGGCGACRFELLEGVVQTLWEGAPGLSERDRKRGKRLACQTRVQGDARIRVRLGGESEQAAVPPQRVTATLSARRAISDDMVELRLTLPRSPGFRAGQYALLYPPGAEGARAYSMSNLDDGSGDWRFIVRRTPGGRGSAVMCAELPVGATVDIDGPYGHAWLRPSPRDVVCVAGGSGLGPMLSIARGVLAEPSERRVHFFLGLRHEGDLGAADQLLALAGDRLSATVVLSSPTLPSAWTGATGFVHSEVERQLAPDLSGYDHYMAGPPPMIEAMQDLLMARHQVPFGQIRFDRFV
jgi:toluene monooxygenase electron transfer component